MIHVRCLTGQDLVNRSRDPGSLKTRQTYVASNLYRYCEHHISVFCRFSVVGCARTWLVEHEGRPLYLELGQWLDKIDKASALLRHQYFVTDLQKIFIPIKRLPSLSCDLCTLTISCGVPCSTRRLCQFVVDAVI